MGVLLTDDEAWAELEHAHTGILTTMRRDGMPVTLPTWFVALDRKVYVRTPAKTRKVEHVQRDPRATFLVERGERWADLCAVMLYATTTVHRDGELVTRVLDALEAKYAAFRTETAALPDATRKHYGGSAVVLELTPTEPPVTWNNAKLALRSPEV
jgi:nitroimidazol reductase NimA-like FMN-containing flavoprotein (pyridoxamine 5'-phosphate oxidase superfamily)